MTVQEIAKQHGVSVQAVYKRIKRAGLSIESLKIPGNTGELTEYGAKSILALYSHSTDQSTPDSTPSPPFDQFQPGLIESITIERDKLKARCDELTTENAALRSAAAEDRTTIATLTEQLSRFSEQAMQQAATAQRLADQAQQLHALQLKALPQPSAHPLRRWLHNLTNKSKSSEADV